MEIKECTCEKCNEGTCHTQNCEESGARFVIFDRYNKACWSLFLCEDCYDHIKNPCRQVTLPKDEHCAKCFNSIKYNDSFQCSKECQMCFRCHEFNHIDNFIPKLSTSVYIQISTNLEIVNEDKEIYLDIDGQYRQRMKINIAYEYYIDKVKDEIIKTSKDDENGIAEVLDGLKHRMDVPLPIIYEKDGLEYVDLVFRGKVIKTYVERSRTDDEERLEWIDVLQNPGMLKNANKESGGAIDDGIAR